MTAPKLSVLVPTYNCASFLPECLDSVLAQDFADCEILISDDCSTDQSSEIIARYAASDARIRWWRNAQNLGQAGNLNLCLREARGELVKFVFADDKLLAPHALRRLVAALADPAVALAASASEVIDARGRLVAQRNHFGADGVHDGAAALVRCLEANGNLIGEPTLAMFRRAPAARGVDGAYSQLIDLELWFHLLAQGKFAFIAEPLAAFRQHPGQLTAQNRRSGAAADEMLRLAETYFAQPWLARAATRRMRFAQAYHLRKQYGARAAAVTARLAAELGAGWYFWFWLERKLVQPFRKLFRRRA